jgi:hypothetical protein
MAGLPVRSSVNGRVAEFKEVTLRLTSQRADPRIGRKPRDDRRREDPVTTRPLIFVSSTSDLTAERQALAAELRPVYDLYLYEEDRARGASPEQRCREQIGRCHVFLGVLGSRYGSPLPGDVEERSIVEWEFDVAREARRENLEIMPFVQHGADAADDPRQKSFLGRLTDFRTGLWCRFFDTPESLVEQARKSLERWLVEYWSLSQGAQRKQSLALHRKVLPAVGLLVALLLAVSLTPLSELLSRNALIALGATVAVVVALALVLLLTESGGRPEP